jgi:hypothetical protein
VIRDLGGSISLGRHSSFGGTEDRCPPAPQVSRAGLHSTIQLQALTCLKWIHIPSSRFFCIEHLYIEHILTPGNSALNGPNTAHPCYPSKATPTTHTPTTPRHHRTLNSTLMETLHGTTTTVYKLLRLLTSLQWQVSTVKTQGTLPILPTTTTTVMSMNTVTSGSRQGRLRGSKGKVALAQGCRLRATTLLVSEISSYHSCGIEGGWLGPIGG